MKYYLGFYLLLFVACAFMAWGLPAMGVSREAQVEWMEESNDDMQTANVWMTEKTFGSLAQLISPQRHPLDLAALALFAILAVRSVIVAMRNAPSWGNKDVGKRALATLFICIVFYALYLLVINI